MTCKFDVEERPGGYINMGQTFLMTNSIGIQVLTYSFRVRSKHALFRFRILRPGRGVTPPGPDHTPTGLAPSIWV